jgi:hypothetical protein
MEGREQTVFKYEQKPVDEYKLKKGGEIVPVDEQTQGD